MASGVLSARWRRAGGVAMAFLGWGPRAGHSLYGLPLLQTLRPQRAGQQESVVRRAAGSVLVPPPRRAWAEQPVFSRWPPAWDGQPGCRVGAGVQARERERKNTETALVEVQSGHRPCPHPSAPYPSSPSRPSEAKNKNVEKKSLYRLPSRKNGGRDGDSFWSPLPTINLQPKSMAQKQDLQRQHWGLQPHPAPSCWCSEGGQLRQAEAAVDAGVVRARVGQAQGL